MIRRILPLAALLVLGAVASLIRADEENTLLADEARLRSAGMPTDTAGLVEFFRLRAKGEVGAAKLAKLLEQLDDKSAVVRQKAIAELLAIGPPAIPLLRAAARDGDNPDLAAQARRCLKALETDSAPLTAAAVRLLASRRARGAVAVLLEYLPHAENAAVMTEVRTALVAAAYDKGKPDPVLLKALSDEHPQRRAMAVIALCSRGIAEPRATLRKLLSDPAPSVRLRAALALGRASDAKAVSTLVALLGDVGVEPAREIEGFLTDLAMDEGPRVTVGEDEESRKKARDAWAKWWLDSEGPGLLDDIRKRTLTEETLTRTQDLIEKLGDDDFDQRQKSETELKKMGVAILPLLRQALKHPDLEVRTRSQRCLDAIEKDKPKPLSPVTARLIALRKPEGAARVLLDYMPFVDDESIGDELQRALNAVAYPDGKASAAVLKALGDKAPARRAAAGAALANGPHADHLATLKKLLADKDANVKLKVGMALAYARENAAVPVLINLIRDLPSDQGARIEEYLTAVARGSAPKGLPEGDENRRKRADAWKTWWDTNSTRVVLLDSRSVQHREGYLGYLMLIQNNNNRVSEIDRKGKQRWELTGVINPWDARTLPGDRVLVAEYNAQRVTERNLKGEILWTKQTGGFFPMQVERLRNGNTFIICRNALIEVNKAGNEVNRINRPINDILTARRMSSGEIVIVSSSRRVVRLDKTGKELKSFFVQQVMYNGNDILPNGGVLIPMGGLNRVMEYSPEGKELATFNVNQASTACRLPNGNTLVVSTQFFPNRLYEYDRKGTMVNQTQLTGYTLRLRYR